MRISCLQETLSKALSIAGRFTAARSSMAVLENLLMEAQDGHIRLVCSTLDISINVWVKATVHDEGAITVPVRLLSEFVTYLPSGQMVDLEFDTKSKQMNVSCGSYSADFNTIEANEFPNVPDTVHLDGARIRQLESRGLRSMIGQTVFAAATGDERPNLAGVDMQFTAGVLTMAATDGFRLSVRSAPMSLSEEEEIKVLVPARALAEMGRILSEADASQAIQMAVTSRSNQILFEIPGFPQENGAFAKVLLVCQLIDAQFPDYHRIIPTSHTARVVTSTASLLKATRASFLFTKADNNIISTHINPADNRISVSSESDQKGASENQIDAQVEGESMDISFNGQYLIDVLSRMESEEVMMELTESSRPCKVLPVGQGSDEFLHVIMPMSNRR